MNEKIVRKTIAIIALLLILANITIIAHADTEARQNVITTVEATEPTTKLETFTPGSMLRECKNCGMKESEMFMDEVNTVSIPSLRLNSNFLNTAEGGIGNSDFVYYTHANRSILTGDMNLEKMNEGEAIYLNTNAGLVSYRVEVSEFSVSDGTDIIGQTSGTSIWDAQYENNLCLYAPYEGGYWMVIASVFEAKS